MNVVPCPLTDLKETFPPSRVTSSRVMDSPSPTPSMPCAPSRRVKASNTRRLSSGVIPCPVSDTLSSRRPPPTSAVTRTSPVKVYLMALLSRLSRIWRMRKASPRHTAVPQPDVEHTSLSPFSAACGRISSTQPETSRDGRKLVFFTSMRPFSS